MKPEEKTQLWRIERPLDKCVLYMLMKKYSLCSKCGIRCKPNIHHKNRNRLDNSKRNLVVLCKVCHGREHGIEGQNAMEEHRHFLSDTCEEISVRNLSNRLSYGFQLLREYE